MDMNTVVNFVKANIAFTIQIVFLALLFIGVSMRNVPTLTFLEIAMLVNAGYLYIQNHKV